MNRKEFITNVALAGTTAMMIPSLAKALVFGSGKGGKRIELVPKFPYPFIK